MGHPRLTPRRWTRAEYERLIDLGTFEREPVELIGGHLLVAEPRSSPHATAIGKVDDALRAAVPSGWIVRAQMPIALGDDSMPEPDLAVVRGTPDDHRGSHPERPALVIEVAESSLHFDRRDKGSLYARGGVEDYWIVNVVARIVEVYRDREPDPSTPYGWRYRSVQAFARGAVVTPLSLPSVGLAVADVIG